MSNSLYITVMEFKALSTRDRSYGYTAADSYGSYYEDSWESLEDFLDDVPTADALKSRVLGSDTFDSFDPDESGRIIINFPVT